MVFQALTELEVLVVRLVKSLEELWSVKFFHIKRFLYKFADEVKFLVLSFWVGPL